MIRKALLGALVALTLIAPVTAASSTVETLRFDDVAGECSSGATFTPEQYEIPVTGDWTTPVVLDVAVLLVGIDEGSAERLMKIAAEPFGSLGIELRWKLEEVDLKVDPVPDTSATAPVISNSDSEAVIQASKDHFGGSRPWWADVVYTMVGTELESAVAGQADCVGGIEYPDSAFAVGEADTSTTEAERKSGKIAAHEIAHLLAAHHHFSNCAEGEIAGGDNALSYCTLMVNVVTVASLKFSTLEGAVVRRWALDHANDTPTEPPVEPDPEPTATSGPGGNENPVVVERSITLRIEGGHARGRVDSASESSGSCSSKVPLALQRKRSGRWTFKTAVFSTENGRYEVPLSVSGRYRMVAPRVERESFDCGKAVSHARRAYV